ncbi:MAG TPA: dienelactone hydrolase family protein [Planctomycetota bacterium]|nr:dienelactone hydrolase family protein [Planctomycetota bacterium]
MTSTQMLLVAGAAALAAAGFGAASDAPPEIVTETVEYRDGDVVLEGYLAYDRSLEGKRPGVMVVHEWKGHGPYVRRRAEELAKLGFVAFAADMYGKGVFAKDHEEAGRLAGVYLGDRALMRRRANAGLDVLRKHARVEPGKLAVMGYCFGGTAALECARAGLDGVRGVASFHGNLATPTPAARGAVTAKVIVFHGADDGMVAKGVDPFQNEMRTAGADWQFVTFGGAVHSFTVKEAGDDPARGIAWHEPSDRRSWKMLQDFLAEALR